MLCFHRKRSVWVGGQEVWNSISGPGGGQPKKDCSVLAEETLKHSPAGAILQPTIAKGCMTRGMSGWRASN